MLTLQIVNRGNMGVVRCLVKHLRYLSAVVIIIFTLSYKCLQCVDSLHVCYDIYLNHTRSNISTNISLACLTISFMFCQQFIIKELKNYSRRETIQTFTIDLL